MKKPTKNQLIEALRAFISQRSGMDFREYGRCREAFLADYNPMIQAGKHARKMLRFVEVDDSITAEKIIAGTSAYCSRLKFEQNERGVFVEYTTGQYFRPNTGQRRAWSWPKLFGIF